MDRSSIKHSWRPNKNMDRWKKKITRQIILWKYINTNKMCLYPTIIRNQKYTANKKNGWQMPAVTDYRTLKTPIGCGECIECMRQKASEWKIRMIEDIKYNKEATFVTLTFNNETLEKLKEECHSKTKEGKNKLIGYSLDNWIATRAVRLFTERWRKHNKKTIRHWLITELGGTRTERIHLHGIIWSKDKDKIIKTWGYIDNKTKEWKRYGYVHCGDYVNEKTISYITKYVTKTDLKHKAYKPIILTSNGIGAGYQHSANSKLNKYTPGETKETYTHKNGTEQALPKYYRNKIYTDEQKEKLWIEKLDKQERYVLKTKIDISQSEDQYWEALKYAQELNKKLGYGDGKRRWRQLEYEEQIRELKRKK
jgi:hypothetical protein